MKGSGGGAMTGALLGTAGQTGIGGLAGSSNVGGQTGTVGGLSEIHTSGGAYGLGKFWLPLKKSCSENLGTFLGKRLALLKFSIFSVIF